MSKDPEKLLPLRPVELQILVSLRGGALHGYGILQEIESRGEGRATPGLVTLYRALKRMEGEGLIERSDTGLQPDEPTDDRRRRYRITPLGQAVLRAEALRLSPLVRAALEGGPPEGGTVG